METKYNIAIFISLVSIIISCISLYLMKLTNDNQKISNIKDNFDNSNININSKAYSTGVSINKGYDNYMSEILNKENNKNCKSYNYGVLGSCVGGISNNSSEVGTTYIGNKCYHNSVAYGTGKLVSIGKYIDSINTASQIKIPYPQVFKDPKCSFTIGKDVTHFGKNSFTVGKDDKFAPSNYSGFSLGMDATCLGKDDFVIK